LNLSEPSGRRFTIAKELYLHGYSHSMRRSVSDSVVSILNFDFCAETIIKTVLLDCGVRIERQKGGYKTYDELISDLRLKFPNLGYIDEVVSLHKLRNDVQHQSNIPSEQEVSVVVCASPRNRVAMINFPWGTALQIPVVDKGEFLAA
jgi:hypothetical protein